VQSDEHAIDALTAKFFAAFTNSGGTARDIDTLYDLFAPDARIIANIGANPKAMDVGGFVEPRRTLLADGSFADFCEREVSSQTEIFGNIGHRFSRYCKSWIASGERREGRGAKSLQFLRAPGGWKIASLVWDDE
jgi:hypothetical protein